MGISVVYCCLQFNSPIDELVPNKDKRVHAKVIRVLDGDTLDLQFYYGCERMRTKIRVQGCDTPEKRARDLEKQACERVTRYVTQLIQNEHNMVEICIRKADKYGGRWVGQVWVNGTDLSSHLVEKGFAKAYSGGEKEVWTNQELNRILHT